MLIHIPKYRPSSKLHLGCVMHSICLSTILWKCSKLCSVIGTNLHRILTFYTSFVSFFLAVQTFQSFECKVFWSRDSKPNFLTSMFWSMPPISGWAIIPGKPFIWMVWISIAKGKDLAEGCKSSETRCLNKKQPKNGPQSSQRSFYFKVMSI